MISPHASADAVGPLTPVAAECMAVGVEALRTSRILDYATFCGLQDDFAGGSYQLWTLRKPLGPHPAGSTIARATLERLLFPGGPGTLGLCYGVTPVQGVPADFAAVKKGGVLP